MNSIDTDSEDELPAGWEERVTIEGKVYYANHELKNTQWEHPATGKKKIIAGELPYGWEIKVDEDGMVCYIDHVNKKTTFTDPRLAFAIEEDEVEGEGGSTRRRTRRIRQRFDASSTPSQILMGRDLTGKFAVVTGANSGIGYETALALACHGAHVTLACRDVSKANAAVDAIKRQRPQANVEVSTLDLMCLQTIRDFAERYMKSNKLLHMLILNAGIFSPPFTLSADSYESTFQTNHLGHFYLTQLLTPVLLRSAPCRVVVVAAEAHRFSDLSCDNLCDQKLSPLNKDQYSPILAYNQSKLCTILFANELFRRLGSERVSVFSVHPGNAVCTGISRRWWAYRLLYTLVRPFAKSKEQAAACSVLCATMRELEGAGGYYINHCARCQPHPEALREDTAAKLWTLSEAMVERARSLGQITSLKSLGTQTGCS